MEFKNKLYRHHKSKISLIVRNFSFALIGFFAVTCSIAIPTYISISHSLEIQTQAVEEKTKNDSDGNEVDPNDNDNQKEQDNNNESND